MLDRREGFTVVHSRIVGVTFTVSKACPVVGIVNQTVIIEKQIRVVIFISILAGSEKSIYTHCAFAVDGIVGATPEIMIESSLGRITFRSIPGYGIFQWISDFTVNGAKPIPFPVIIGIGAKQVPFLSSVIEIQRAIIAGKGTAANGSYTI